MDKKRVIKPGESYWNKSKEEKEKESEELLKKMMNKEFKKRINEKADSGDESFMKTLKNFMSDDKNPMIKKLYENDDSDKSK